MSRSRNLLGLVRIKLNKFSSQDLKDDVIYAAANAAQTKIIHRLRTLETSFEINFTPGVENYDYSEENISDIKNVFPSWDGEIEYIPNNNWDEYRQSQGSRPCYYTAFAGQLYFSPVPMSADDKVTFWALMSKASIDISDNYEPEIPPALDDVLVLATCAEFNPDFIPLWEAEVDRRKSTMVRKQSKNMQIKSDW